MLIVMFVLGVTSMAHDSAIVDELAHIPAGYSYVHYGDYRLNPEHPPLMKVLAGIPLQFMNLKFPTDLPAWTTDVNGQWEVGWSFLYHLGNNATRILFWSRLPILLLAIGFGAFFYRFLLRRYGIAVGLLGLFFYTFSPNILAHAHYVTTDMGAAIFMFGALVTCARFMTKPTGANLLLFSLGLAGAQVSKFSAVVLYPFLGLFVLMGALAKDRPTDWKLRVRGYLGGFLLASALSIFWIWLAYIPETWHMPIAVQQNLINGALPTQPHTAAILAPLAAVPGLKPLVQFVLGIAMVFSRVHGGNVTYFLGQINDASFRGYFPVLFALKTQIAFLVLMLVVGVARVWTVLQRHGRMSHHVVAGWLDRHWLEVTLGVFAVFYFLLAVFGNLDLGIRHILPVYLPLFVLVPLGMTWLWRNYLVRWRQAPWIRIGVAGLLVWYGAATLWVYPNFLAYFNEFIGGPANSGSYFSDSSVDWGQDLLRFDDYVKAHPEIDTVALDYFGGADPRYYFCGRLFHPDGSLIADSSGYDCSHSRVQFWHAQLGAYSGQYLAVSETYLENDRFFSAQRGDQGYAYLYNKKPIAKIGYSIYLFKLR
jgi:hypothetical protein